MLDSFLIGSVAKSPSMSGHNLTTKVDGKTVTRYVQKGIAPMAMKMNRRYKKLWTLIQKCSNKQFGRGQVYIIGYYKF